MRYLFYFIAMIILQIVAYIITPILPLFTEIRYGKLNNSNLYGDGIRLEKWLSWFDTPDNSLSGDENWQAKYPETTYWSMVKWLYRNSIYGFKWDVISCLVENPDQIDFSGNPDINRNNGITGTFKAKYKGYWQFKIVKKLFGDFGIMWNFGWQLDEYVGSPHGGKALFQFSPRFVSIK